MKRTIINIDEEKCNGCGICVPNCHEGALQIIDGKARLISELFCDGLGACIGHCPEDAITLEEREAEPYDEIKVMERISKQGRNTILAHLHHLKDHGETELLKQAVNYIKENGIDVSPEGNGPKHSGHTAPAQGSSDCGGGCPGSASINLSSEPKEEQPAATSGPVASQLGQWPVQLHLLNPEAAYFKNADVVLAADCVAYAMGDFHNRYLKGKTLAIACPKLDTNKESYVEKLVTMIDSAQIDTITVVMMEVPCCGGLAQLVHMAMQQANRLVPVKKVTVSVRGEVLDEKWMMPAPQQS
ncbi:MAG: 4Fe-4S binding protein [Bacteroidales bacterium]|nr:4Fe-4S binding protein [Bacteroidales bacterium]